MAGKFMQVKNEFAVDSSIDRTHSVISFKSILSAMIKLY